MINTSIVATDIATSYKNATPFPHAVIDNFLEEKLANSIFDELNSVDISNWYHDSHHYQINKWSMSDLSRLPEVTANTLSEFNSSKTLSFFEHGFIFFWYVGEPYCSEMTALSVIIV